jgi:hypothetical protein
MLRLLLFALRWLRHSEGMCLVKREDPSGQRWGTFLRNHSPHIAAMDLFVVPTVGFIQLYVLVIVRLARRELVWVNVTRHPTAEWIAQQITEAFPWTEAPRYLVRDRDGIYGTAVSVGCAPWASGTSRSLQVHHGRMDTLRG